MAADLNGDKVVNLKDFAFAAKGGSCARLAGVTDHWLEGCNNTMKRPYAQFDGSGRITIPDNSVFVIGVGSYALLVEIDAFAGDDGYLFAKESIADNAWINIQDKVTTLALNASNAPSDYWCHVTKSALPSGRKAILFIFDSSVNTFYVYCNGVKVDAEHINIVKTGSIPNVTNSGNLTLGVDPTPDYWTGKLYQFAIYKTVLSDAEAKTLTLGQSISTKADYASNFSLIDGTTVAGYLASGIQLNGIASGGVTFGADDAAQLTEADSVTSLIEDWIIEQLSAIEYQNSAVFKTVEEWKHQVGEGGSGAESFTRYAPFAFTTYMSDDADREGSYDAVPVFRFAVAIGFESAADGLARRACEKIRDLVITAIEKQQPSGIGCDRMFYLGCGESVNRTRQYAMELHFECKYVLGY
jgi:hypothetical protein